MPDAACVTAGCQKRVAAGSGPKSQRDRSSSVQDEKRRCHTRNVGGRPCLVCVEARALPQTSQLQGLVLPKLSSTVLRCAVLVSCRWVHAAGQAICHAELSAAGTRKAEGDGRLGNPHCGSNSVACDRRSCAITASLLCRSGRVCHKTDMPTAEHCHYETTLHRRALLSGPSAGTDACQWAPTTSARFGGRVRTPSSVNDVSVQPLLEPASASVLPGMQRPPLSSCGLPDMRRAPPRSCGAVLMPAFQVGSRAVDQSDVIRHLTDSLDSGRHARDADR